MSALHDKAAHETQSVDREPRTVSSGVLFGKRKTLVIEHEGEFYTLRITANRKLILTK